MLARLRDNEDGAISLDAPVRQTAKVAWRSWEHAFVPHVIHSVLGCRGQRVGQRCGCELQAVALGQAGAQARTCLSKCSML